MLSIFLGIGFITPMGIYFNSSFYTCKPAIREQWFGSAEAFHYREVVIAYRKYEVTRVWVVCDLEFHVALRIHPIRLMDTEVVNQYHQEINMLKQLRRANKRKRVSTNKNSIN